MAAYVILDITVSDPEAYEEYKALSGAALEAYGGRFLVRGGPCETVEGDWKPNRVVVVEFESKEQAKTWYRSQEYAPALKIRQQASTADMILVEGA